MDVTTSKNVFETIEAFLNSHDVEYVVKDHKPTLTSEESAAARGEKLSTGAKALLVKCDGEFCLFVLPADCKLDSKAVKRQLAVRKIRFASTNELLELTGLVPGSVPPFGKPVFAFPLYIDERLKQNDRVAFNAGLLTRSIIMPASEYFHVVDGQFGTFSKAE